MQQQNPNPNAQLHTHTTYLNTAPYPSYYPHYPPQQNPNPIPNNPQLPYQSAHVPYYSVAVDTSLNPPGVDQHSSVSSYPQSHYHGGGYEVQQPGGVTYAHSQTVSVESVSAPYYVDPNAGTTVHNEAVIPYTTGLPPNGIEQFVPAVPNSVSWTHPTTRPKGTWKRAPKTKVVQSAWCEVCKVCCDTKDVLDLHKLGKKHKKNLEKLKEASTPAPVLVVSAGSENPVIEPPENPCNSEFVIGKKAGETLQKKVVESARCEVCKVCCDTKDVLDVHKLGKKHKKNLEKLKRAFIPAPVPVGLAGSENPVIGPPQNPTKSGSVSRQKSKKKAAESLEDLERKRRKVMEGGAAATAVRTCAICNVVCNSETVFKYHLAGQKHIAVMKKLASRTISIPSAN